MIEYSSDSILKARTTIGNAHDFTCKLLNFFPTYVWDLLHYVYSIEKYVCHLGQESLIFGFKIPLHVWVYSSIFSYRYCEVSVLLLS